MSDHGLYVVLDPSDAQRIVSLETPPSRQRYHSHRPIAVNWRRACLVLDELAPLYRGRETGDVLSADELSHPMQMLLLPFGFPLTDPQYRGTVDGYRTAPVFVLKSPEEVARISAWFRRVGTMAPCQHYLRFASPNAGYPGLDDGVGQFLGELHKVKQFFADARARERWIAYAAFRRWERGRTSRRSADTRPAPVKVTRSRNGASGRSRRRGRQ